MNGMSVPINNWNMGSSSLSDAQAFDLAAAEPEVVDHAREHHGGEQVGDQADAERDSEALDRAGPELEQEQRRDQRGGVRVEDGSEGAVIAQPHRLVDAPAGAQLLADALEDQHVRVHGHAD